MSAKEKENEESGEFFAFYRNETSFKLSLFPPNNTDTFTGFKVGGESAHFH